MDIESAAKALKELGHPTRLQLFKSIVKAGRQGIAVGALQERLSIPGSTLSHHLSALASASLLHQRREGRTLFCVAEYQMLEAVLDFIQAECCADEEQPLCCDDDVDAKSKP